MDRSFLSQPEVIAVSRRLICVRLTTYENKEEGEFLKTLTRTRSGDLENTVLAVLAAVISLAAAGSTAYMIWGLPN